MNTNIEIIVPYKDIAPLFRVRNENLGLPSELVASSTSIENIPKGVNFGHVLHSIFYDVVSPLDFESSFSGKFEKFDFESESKAASSLALTTSISNRGKKDFYFEFSRTPFERYYASCSINASYSNDCESYFVWLDYLLEIQMADGTTAKSQFRSLPDARSLGHQLINLGTKESLKIKRSIYFSLWEKLKIYYVQGYEKYYYRKEWLPWSRVYGFRELNGDSLPNELMQKMAE